MRDPSLSDPLLTQINWQPIHPIYIRKYNLFAFDDTVSGVKWLENRFSISLLRQILRGGAHSLSLLWNCHPPPCETNPIQLFPNSLPTTCLVCVIIRFWKTENLNNVVFCPPFLVIIECFLIKKIWLNARRVKRFFCRRIFAEDIVSLLCCVEPKIPFHCGFPSSSSHLNGMLTRRVTTELGRGWGD